MKKFIPLVLVASFFFGVGMISAQTKTFPDVQSSDWYYNDVMNMVEWDVIRGNDDGTFKPSNNVNRAELSAMWNRYEGHLDNKFAVKGTTSTGSNYDYDIGEIYKLIALSSVKDAQLWYLQQSNNRLFNLLLGEEVYTIQCDNNFDLYKLTAKKIMEDAEKYSGSLYNDTIEIENMIDTYEDKCYAL